jgi:hypothetical protein
MVFKMDIVGTILPLAAVAGVAYFAITYGPGIMDTINAQLQTVLSAGLQAPPVSGVTAIVSGTTGTCTTGNTQMDQMITAAGMDLCQYTGQTSGAAGAGGIGAINQGMPSPIGSAWQNTGGIPGQMPGTIAPNYALGINYPQFTGAPQFQSTPLGSAQITCPNGICRSYVGEVINV